MYLWCYFALFLSAETQDEIKEKAAFEDLEQSFKTLTSRKIKDKLSAFLPDIPGKYHHGNCYVLSRQSS